MDLSPCWAFLGCFSEGAPGWGSCPERDGPHHSCRAGFPAVLGEMCIIPPPPRRGLCLVSFAPVYTSHTWWGLGSGMDQPVSGPARLPLGVERGAEEYPVIWPLMSRLGKRRKQGRQSVYLLLSPSLPSLPWSLRHTLYSGVAAAVGGRGTSLSSCTAQPSALPLSLVIALQECHLLL